MIELLSREGIRRHDIQWMALYRADERQRHAGASASVFDDGTAYVGGIPVSVESRLGKGSLFTRRLAKGRA